MPVFVNPPKSIFIRCGFSALSFPACARKHPWPHLQAKFLLFQVFTIRLITNSRASYLQVQFTLRLAIRKKKMATTEGIFVLDNTFSRPPVITNSRDADTAHSISQPLATWKDRSNKLCQQQRWSIHAPPWSSQCQPLLAHLRTDSPPWCRQVQKARLRATACQIKNTKCHRSGQQDHETASFVGSLTISPRDNIGFWWLVLVLHGWLTTFRKLWC